MIAISINIIFFLVCFLPYALVTGPFIPDMFISLISILFLFISLKLNLWNYYKIFFFKFFCLFYFIINLSSFFSENIFISLKTSLPYFRFGLFTLAVIFIFKNKKKFELFFFKNLILVILILLLDGLIQFFFGYNMIGFVYNLLGMQIPSQYLLGSQNRITSLFGDESLYGSYLVRLSPIFFYLILKFRFFNNFNILIFFIFIFSIFLAVIFSNERTALLLFLIFLSYNFIFQKKFKYFRISIIILLIFSILLIFNNKQLNYRYVITTKYLFYNLLKNEPKKQQIEKENLNTEKYNSPQNYLLLLKTSVSMFYDSPLVGKGVRSFKYLSADNRFATEDNLGNIYFNSHPHNYYFQLLAETGLLGFVFIFFSLLFFLYKTFFHLNKKYYLKKNYEIILFSGFLFILWPITTTGNFFNNWLSIFNFLLLGIFFGNYYKNNFIKK